MVKSKTLKSISFDIPFTRIVSSPAEMDARLRARPSIGEAAALMVALFFLAGYVWMLANGYDAPGDYNIYVRTAAGDRSFYYYAFWLIPVYGLFGALPGYTGYILWSLVSILCVFFAARVFGGIPALALISYQYLALLYFGQITGLLIGGLTLFWWGLNHRRWAAAGLGLLIGCTKFQVGVPIGLALFLFCDQPWSLRLKTLVVPAAGAGLSLVLYPGWPLEILRYLQSVPPDSSASIAPWRYIGPAALLFWLPPLLLPLKRERRIAALVAAAALGLPYFQQADLVCLYAFPFGWLPLTGLLGLTFKNFAWPDYRVLTFIPLLMYLAALLPVPFRNKRADSSQTASSTNPHG